MLTEALHGTNAAGRIVHATRRAMHRIGSGRSAGMSWASALCAGATLASCLAGATPARAQAIAPGDTRDFSVKLGTYLPLNRDTRRAGAVAIPMVEIDYTIQKFPESHFSSLLSVGFLDHASFRMMPITVSQVYRDPANASGFDYYYGVGVGLYNTRLRLADTDNRSKYLFGGFVVTGIDVTRTVFLEAKYHLISHYDRKDVSGLQASVGLRF